MTLRVSNSNDVKIYTVSSSTRSAIPDWLARQRKKDLKHDIDWSKRVDLIQDFCFPEASNKIKITPDSKYIVATGTYKPQMRIYDLSQLSMKFERHTDAENVDFEILSSDWRKLLLLQVDRSIEFHTQNGMHYRTRIPTFGRALKYDQSTCDAIIVGGSPDVYRVNLEIGRFMNSFNTSSPGINVAELNSFSKLWAFGSEDGFIEFFDGRQRDRIARFSPFVEDCEITSFLFLRDGFHYSVGNSFGKINIMDLRSKNAIVTKYHSSEDRVIKITEAPNNNILSADKKSIRVWNKDTATNFCAYEPEHDLNDLLLIEKSGMIMTANEGSFMNALFIPSLGPAPAFCTFLDNITEELEESHTNPFDDYKFVTKKELETLGLDHMIGTNVLKAYMHGYFLDVRLYEKARVIANPFAYDDYKKKLVKERLENEAKSRISASNKLPKVNKALAKKLLENETPGKSNKDQNLVTDDRFKELFADPLFEIDEENAEYVKFHTKPKATKKVSKEAASTDDEINEVEGVASSDEDSVYGETENISKSKGYTDTKKTTRNRKEYTWERPKKSKAVKSDNRSFHQRIKKNSGKPVHSSSRNRPSDGAMSMSFKAKSKRNNK